MGCYLCLFLSSVWAQTKQAKPEINPTEELKIESATKSAANLAADSEVESAPESAPDTDPSLPPEVLVEAPPQLVRPRGSPPIWGSDFYAGSRSVLEVDGGELSDTLEQAPGILVERSGGVLSPSRLSIRGGRSGQVLVLWDDELLNEEQPHPSVVLGEDGVDLNRIPAEWVDSVEVVRGAAGALSGSGIGGVSGLVRLRSKPRSGWGFQTTKGENMEAWQLYGSTAPSGQQLAVVLNYRQSDEEYIYYDARHAAGQRGNLCAKKLDGNYYLRRCQQRRFIHSRFDWSAPNWKQRFEWDEETQSGLGGIADPKPYGLKRVRRWKIGHQQQILGWNWNASLNSLQGERDENTQLSHPDTENHWQNNKLRLNTKHQWQHLPYQLLLEVGISQQQLRDKKLNAQRQIQFVRLHTEYRSPRATSELSLRHDQLEDQQSEITSAAPIRPQQLSSTSWRAASSLKFFSHGGIKFSLGQAHQPPALYQLYDPSLSPAESLANPLLKPEHSSSQDLGLFLQYNPHLYAEWIAFQQTIRDNIIPIAKEENPIQFRFENIHQVRSTGSETLLGWRIRHTYLDASLTKLKAIIQKNNANDPRYNGNFVPQQPQKQLNFRLGNKLPRWQTEIRSRQTSRRYLNPANTRFLVPYRLYHLHLSFKPTPSWKISLNIRNLTNITYAERENYPPPGRQWFLNLSFQKP